MALDSYVDSSCKGRVPAVVPSLVGGGGGLTHSSSSSGIFFHGDGQSSGSSNFGPVHGDMNNGTMNTAVYSGPSVGASSLVTDANSSLSGGPQLQRSASINTESYMRVPASPISFSSNNMSVSGSLVIDGSSVVQQSNRLDPGGASSSATSLPTSQAGHVDPRGDGLLIMDHEKLSQVQKKPKLDVRHEDILQQQVLQQMLQRQDSLPLHNNRNPQLQTFLNLQRLRQQQLLQSVPPLQRAHIHHQHHHQQQQQQMQMLLRQQMQQRQPVSAMNRPSDGGVCARRLMQYLYHQRQRPAENTVAYWRKFVAEYYSPHAKERWCLSQYNNIGHQALGVFPQAAMEAWRCEICGSKFGRGFEATFEVLPRLNEVKFGGGIIDELLFLDLPRECRLPSGIMMLEYGKAVQESVYEQLRVVREGQLRIMFTHDLKILSWEFCARRHEELIPRRVIAPQVNQLVQVAQKCQSTITESGSNGVSQQDLQSNSNMVTAAGRQLGKALELPSLNELGFSKRYVRCLQISEVVTSMKDLLDFCHSNKVGPIEGLKNYTQHATAAKLQNEKMQEMEQLANVNKLMALYPGVNNATSSNNPMVGRGALSGSPQAVLAPANYPNLLARQSSMNSNSDLLPKQEAALTFKYSNPNPSSTIQRTMQNYPGSAVSSQCYMPARSMRSNSLQLQRTDPEPSETNHAIQHQMGQQPALAGRDRNGMSFAGSSIVSESGIVPTSSQTDSVKATTSNNDNNSSFAGGRVAISNQTEPDFAPDLHIDDELIQDIAREFTTNGFFDDDLDGRIGHSWKA